jgi:hypothetical protein
MKLSNRSEPAVTQTATRRRPQAGAAETRTARSSRSQCACGSATCAGCPSAATASSTRTGTVSRNGGTETETQTVGPVAGPVAAPAYDHCAQSGAFTSIPSGTVAATMSGGRLQAPFVMQATFSAAIPCSCSAGEYRQFVRGEFTSDGADVTHNLGPGRPMSKTVFQEDGDVGLGTVYGHRAIPGTKSRFLPDQAEGCQFEGEDEPGISGPSGKVVTMNLDFIGVLIDTARSNRILAARMWSVAGSGTMP